MIYNKLHHSYIWLKRFRKRRGYGVHSPFAFQLITGVIYEKLPYYKYAELKEQIKEELAKHPSDWSYKDSKVRKLLFRLSNFIHPENIIEIGETTLAIKYMQAGCISATASHFENLQHCSKSLQKDAELVLLHPKGGERFHTDDINHLMQHISKKGLLILDDIHRNKKMNELWQLCITHPKAGITFDLYELGLIFFDNSKVKQDYIVNF